jgi:hypothetical protein
MSRAQHYGRIAARIGFEGHYPMDVQQPLIPAAWYPDPADHARQRWWDGSAWTDKVTDLLAPAPDPAPVAALAVSPSVALDQEGLSQNVLTQEVADDNALTEEAGEDNALTEEIAEDNALAEEAGEQNILNQELAENNVLSRETTAQNALTRRQLREQVGALVTGEVDIKTPSRRPAPAIYTPELRSEPTFEPVEPSWDSDQFGRSAYVPMAPLRVSQPVLTPRTQGSSTLAVWLLAVSPLWIVAATLALRQIGVIPQSGVTFLVGMVALVLALVLANTDRKRLVARGFDPTVHPAWVLIPLVYFILRTVRVGRGGLGPLILFVLLQIGLVTLIIAATVVTSLYPTAAA